jgi:alpha-L-fucosidase
VPDLTRRGFLAATAGALVVPGVSLASFAWEGPRPTPSPAQLEWQRDELALFTHFGVNTFTDREWGDGTEDPAIFNPSKLDTRQWAKAARAAGFRAMILTAKHHDGFCLWPSRMTTHSVASSPFRNGHGDVVREFVDACRAEHLKVGLYLSPWDRHEPRYGDSDRYNDYYCDQLTELLTHYGSIAEVWFDGANGEGPNGKKQTYDWPRVWGLVRRLQPKAVMFSDAGPDVRWIGNENGSAGLTNWSTQDPAVVPAPGVSGPGVTRMLQQGDPNGAVWRPGETDVSIRPGWFHHPAEDIRVKTTDNLVDLYFTSVGRNSKLLLNVPPTREGLLHDTDVARLADMRVRLTAMFSSDFAKGWRPTWTTSGARRAETASDGSAQRRWTAASEIDLGRNVTIGIADLREDIEHGQMVAHYTLEGAGDDGEFKPMSTGTTIGCKKLDRFSPVAVRRVRLTIDDAVAAPRPVEIRLYVAI